MTASAAVSVVRSSRKAGSPSSRRRKVTLAGPALGRDQHVLVGRSVVACPYNGNDRIQVSVNRRVDILAQERERLGENSYFVGRILQEAWERQSGARSGKGGLDLGTRGETDAQLRRMCALIADAKAINELNANVAAAVGAVGVRVLRALLVEGQTFAAYAARTGKGSGEKAATEIAKRFRWLLEAVTEAMFTATGAEGQFIRATREPA